jgi:L-ribulokinase
VTGPVCAVGVDFGTESARALVLELETGAELGSAVAAYPHGVIEGRLPGTGEELPPDWALQDPDDWLQALERSVVGAMEQAGIESEGVRGIGIDFTSCTVLPVDAEGAPLCTSPFWRNRKHAWPKLWKHHAAQAVADRLTEVALERGEEFIARYGGRSSSEWYFPKLIQMWLEDRDLYAASYGFIEATDWVVWQLTGQERRQQCTAGYKALWSPDTGLPSPDYFDAAYPGFTRPAEKLGDRFLPLGTRAGGTRPALAARLGVEPGTPVAVGNVDSFASVPGAGVAEPGAFVSAIGTSICDMVVYPEEVRLPGITGVVRDGILPRLYGYEAGQAAVGDMLGWFVRRVAPAEATHESLERQATELQPGESGLVALDWWNGNRTVLADADLTGVIAGLTLQSTHRHLYRALLEAIAFGNRRIVENFTEQGVPVDHIVACGGVSRSSPLLMQLFADVSGLEVRVPAPSEVAARGAALFAGVAAGTFAEIQAAVDATRPELARTYVPDSVSRPIYDELYSIYRGLHDLLGCSHVELLHRLKRMRTEAAPA